MRQLMRIVAMISMLVIYFGSSAGTRSALAADVQESDSRAMLAELREFTTDGCSAFVDGPVFSRHRWLHCCISHDLEYWIGGPPAVKTAADRELRRCVAATLPKSQWVDGAMYWAVRAGGVHFLPTPWRWGYGWHWLKPRVDRSVFQGNVQLIREKFESFAKVWQDGVGFAAKMTSDQRNYVTARLDEFLQQFDSSDSHR